MVNLHVKQKRSLLFKGAVDIVILTSSMSAQSSAGRGLALRNRRLCLLVVLVRQLSGDISVTVSRNETTGCDFCNKGTKVLLIRII